MSNQTNKPTSVKILNKTYEVKCPLESIHELLEAAEVLDQKMRDIHSQGKTFALEHILVTAALNMTHALLQAQKQHHAYAHSVQGQIESLQKKIDTALMEELEQEANE